MKRAELFSLFLTAVGTFAMTVDVATGPPADAFVYYTYFLALVHVEMVAVASRVLVPRIRMHERNDPGGYTYALWGNTLLGMAGGTVSAGAWAYDEGLSSVRIAAGILVAGNLIFTAFAYFGWAINLQDPHSLSLPVAPDDPDEEAQRVLARVDGLAPPNE